MAGPLDNLTLGEYALWIVFFMIVGALVGKFLVAWRRTWMILASSVDVK